MSDLKVGEPFKHRVRVIETATGLPWAGQLPTVIIIDESDNAAVAAAATEEALGWYHYTFTPDAAGTWQSVWFLAGATFEHSPLTFKVGGGAIGQIATVDLPACHADVNVAIADIATVAGLHDVPLQNSALNNEMSEVVGNKTDTAAGTSLVAKVVDINADIVAVDALHNVPVQNSAANDRLRDAVGNKTDTTAGTSVIAILKQILEDTGTTLDDLVDDIEGRLTAARAGYMDKIANHLITRTWFSDTDDSITCNTDSSDLTLPSVVLPNIAGTIVSAYAGIKFRMIENTNAGTNGLNGVQDIQVKESVAGAYVDAVNLADNQWLLAATTREGGDCVIGDIDIVGQVAAFNKTYNFIIDDNDVDQASLVLNDVQTFLIVSYY